MFPKNLPVFEGAGSGEGISQHVVLRPYVFSVEPKLVADLVQGYEPRHAKANVCAGPAVPNEPQASLVVGEGLNVGFCPTFAPQMHCNDESHELEIRDVKVLILVGRGARKIFVGGETVAANTGLAVKPAVAACVHRES